MDKQQSPSKLLYCKSVAEHLLTSRGGFRPGEIPVIASWAPEEGVRSALGDEAYTEWVVDCVAVIAAPRTLNMKEEITAATVRACRVVVRDLLKKISRGRKYSGKSYINRRNRKRSKRR